MSRQVIGICSLCKEESNLLKSHIIPKFVTNWIKETSITKGLRVATNKNKRLEDGIKKRLLCKNCEKILSKFESHFSTNVFHPFLKGEKSFSHNEDINKFISSISWRVLAMEMEEFITDYPEHKEKIIGAEENLRKFILGEDELYLKNYIFHFDDRKLTYSDVDEKFHWYIQRSTDGAIASSKEVVYIYSKFPKMFFITAIEPREFLGGGEVLFKDGKGNFAIDGASNLILDEGVFNQNKVVFHTSFEKFLLHRVEEANLNKMSEEQQNKLKKRIKTNANRIIGSESLKTHLISKGNLK